MVSSFQKVVDAKREQRQNALATAGAPSAGHTKYLHATGSSSRILSFRDSSLNVRVISFSDCLPYPEWRMDGFGSLGSLHLAGSSGTRSYELPHRRYAHRITCPHEINVVCACPTVMFGWGRMQAKTLDDEFAATGKIRGPLHGVPVSCTANYSLPRALKTVTIYRSV